MKTFTIFKSDELYDHGMTSLEVTEAIGLAQSAVYAYAKKGIRYKKEYCLAQEVDGLPASIKDVGKNLEVEIEQNLKDKWEEMRLAFKLLKSGKGRIVKKDGKKYVEVK